MLKVYEKPKLVALSISSNDSLCAGCGFDVDDLPPGLGEMIEDFPEFYFGPEEGCANIIAYCKFNSSDKLFSS